MSPSSRPVSTCLIALAVLVTIVGPPASTSSAQAAVTAEASVASAQAAVDCLDPSNEIVAENCLTGSPPSVWDVTGAGDSSIQGFATDISVDQGGTVDFKIDTPSTDYRLDIYRLGWYEGDGARLVDTIQPSAVLPQTQPVCLEIDGATNDNLIDCGNWGVSASWTVPAAAVSGVYIARATREDVGGDVASHIAFIVRDDDGASDLLFQTSDTTWQAYNRYGGYSLYDGPGHAHKVSYNRPFTTRGAPTEDWLFNAEYPMIRWLERNGYDVSYFTDVDSDRRGAEIPEHEAFLSVGHDEYWSAGQRANVEAARDAGTDLAFFSGNEIYWKTRWEASTTDGGAFRTLVSYKEGDAQGSEHWNCLGNFDCDPHPTTWTGLWRQNQTGHDGGRPENALSGQISWGDATAAIQVPAAATALRFWRNTGMSGATTLDRRHARLRVRLGAAGVRRFEPARSDHAVRHDGCGQEPQDEPVPRPGERCARLRRRHRPVVVGPRRHPRPRVVHRGPQDAAGHRQPALRHGGAAGDVAGQPRPGRAARHDRPDRHHHRSGGRCDRPGRERHDLGHGRRHRRRRRGGRGLDGQRNDLEPRRPARRTGPTRSTRPAVRSRRRRARSTTPPTSAPPRA